MKSIFSIGISFIMFLTSGCATMFNGSNANVSVRSDDPNAKIYLNDTYMGKGSAVVEVPKKGNYFLRVSRDGCADNAVPVGKQLDPATLLGILIDFGIISILVVDGLVTGAVNDVYPKNYVLNPICQQSEVKVSPR